MTRQYAGPHKSSSPGFEGDKTPMHTSRRSASQADIFVLELGGHDEIDLILSFGPLTSYFFFDAGFLAGDFLTGDFLAAGFLTEAGFFEMDCARQWRLQLCANFVSEWSAKVHLRVVSKTKIFPTNSRPLPWKGSAAGRITQECGGEPRSPGRTPSLPGAQGAPPLRTDAARKGGDKRAFLRAAGLAAFLAAGFLAEGLGGICAAKRTAVRRAALSSERVAGERGGLTLRGRAFDG